MVSGHKDRRINDRFDGQMDRQMMGGCRETYIPTHTHACIATCIISLMNGWMDR